MTRFNFGLAAVTEEDLPGLVENKFFGFGASTTYANVPLGPVASTRKMIVAIQFRVNNGVMNWVRLDGFDLQHIGSPGDNIGDSNTLYHSWWIIDAGAGSLLENLTDADLSFNTNGSLFIVHVWRVEHASAIADLRRIASSTGTSRSLSQALARNGVMMGAYTNTGSGVAVSTINWTGITKEADHVNPGVYFASNASDKTPVAENRTITVTTNVNAAGGHSVLSLGKGNPPTYEYTDQDRQDTVGGDIMTSPNLSIGSGTDRKFIVASAHMNKNVTYASIKCNGVDMILAAKNNKSINNNPVSVGLYYLPITSLPEQSATEAEFKVRVASGDAGSVLVVGVIRGGIGLLKEAVADYFSTIPAGAVAGSIWVTTQVKRVGTTPNLLDEVNPAAATNFLSLLGRDVDIRDGLPNDNWMVVSTHMNKPLPYSDLLLGVRQENADYSHISSASHVYAGAMFI